MWTVLLLPLLRYFFTLFQLWKADAELAVCGVERFASYGFTAYHLHVGNIVDTFTHLVDSSNTANILSHIFGEAVDKEKIGI